MTQELQQQMLATNRSFDRQWIAAMPDEVLAVLVNRLAVSNPDTADDDEKASDFVCRLAYHRVIELIMDARQDFLLAHMIAWPRIAGAPVRE